ncbi:hypothetical protein ALQ07_102145 [Pseudomonas syringae pv. actinidiae]|uniref:Uncharacterized protein n=3 Tax=Pseudomonas syringae group TaxID=136849 RepID=A0A3M4KVR6_PSESF|nr:hypothetical protein ALO40_101972 [Pseudomonas syringae pv. viburni]RMO71416.1 hypothetical protein ALQ36_102635 [Pseudomonas syringae pv. primulae]RMQ33299.1 hypothetical protein ALQ07_102145 [Pseudomonas syringae pv. actinidiae]
MILLLSREVLLICVNLCPEENWQGVPGSALGTTHGGRMLAYEPRETSFQNVNRSQDAHELSES